MRAGLLAKANTPGIYFWGAIGKSQYAPGLRRLPAQGRQYAAEVHVNVFNFTIMEKMEESMPEHEKSRTVCELCPNACRLYEGQIGGCHARAAKDGVVEPVRYGALSACHLDPIEKKPLYHFYPGSRAYSLGGFGCNLKCRGCQNAEISRVCALDGEVLFKPARRIADEACALSAKSVAYTYNEPIVWWEFMNEVALEAHAVGLKNVIVTAGYVCEKYRERVFSQMDAGNVDLKGFSEAFYRDWAGGGLANVLETIEYLHQRENFWLELTTLVIPGKNDDPAMLEREFAWIYEHLGAHVPLHLSAFFPAYHAQDIESTPVATLEMARDLALEAGLRDVYLGNVMDYADTLCPRCGATVIRRMGYRVEMQNMRGNGCAFCGERIGGVFGAR